MSEANKEIQILPIQHIVELFAHDGRDFIVEAYRNLLGRDPDPQGMAYYLGRLAMGYGKARIIVQIVSSPEFKDKRKVGGLKQLITTEKCTAHWFCGLFNQRERKEILLRQGIEELAQIRKKIDRLLRNKIQARTKVKMHTIRHVFELFAYDDKDFIRLVYLTFLNREPDLNGLQYYLGRLRMGCGKAYIVAKIAKSSEATETYDIIGLDRLILDEYRSTHWFWGLFTRRNRTYKLQNQICNELSLIKMQLSQMDDTLEDLEPWNFSRPIQSQVEGGLNTENVLNKHIENIAEAGNESPQNILFQAKNELNHLDRRSKDIYMSLIGALKKQNGDR